VRNFDDWYRELYPRLHTAIRISCGSIDDADEAVAEAFARASARWSRVGAMDNPDGWTYTVALNVTRQRGRRRARDRELAAVAGSRVPTHDDAAATVRFIELVHDLPERMREVIVLRHVADLTEPMIAEVLGISRGTVSSTLRDAHRRLGSRLLAERNGEAP
jgi:RNA polymerase sigma-70 factor (ECF subfamily)